MRKCLIITNSLSKNAGGVGSVLNLLWEYKTFRNNKLLYNESEKSLFVDKLVTEPISLDTVLSMYKPEVIHIHGMWDKNILNLLRYKIKYKRVKFIITPHGMLSDWALKRGMLKKLFYIFVIKVFIKKLCFQALNYEEKKDIEKYFLGKNIFVVGNPAVTVPSVIKKKNEYEFVSIGRICEQKNSLEFCEKYNKISNEYTDLPKIRFYGWSENNKYFEAFKKQIDISSRLEYKGSLKHKEVPTILLKSRMFIIFSNFEGFPMSCIEALGNQCIVIGNKTSGLSGLEKSSNVKIINGKIEDFIMALKDFQKSKLVFDENDNSLEEYKVKNITMKLNDMYRNV